MGTRLLPEEKIEAFNRLKEEYDSHEAEIVTLLQKVSLSDEDMNRIRQLSEEQLEMHRKRMAMLIS
ncbi:hypothetical protein [Sinorhizobium meliloti]|uniref:hypothetical protein n=1 Tax=Rhizobium meliloti TaxID=382 RepID=UPI00041B2754|nr:hypothetical protein [Sinorhizobium meliloti]